MDVLSAVGLFVTSLIASVVGLLVVALLSPPPQRARGLLTADRGGEGGTVLLFDGEHLVDASPAARELLAQSPVRGGNWLRLIARLGPLFPDLEARVLSLPREGRFLLQATGARSGVLLLRGEAVGGLVRLTLLGGEDEAGDSARGGPDAASHLALAEEVAALRAITAQAPLPIWKETAEGEVIWANAAYLQLASDRLAPGQELTWPLPRLFDRMATAQAAVGQRQRLDLPGGRSPWFDLTSVSEGGGRLAYALPADAAVQAEAALREFMQTLTKTFAHLPIGLAVFDRNRQLQLFNPALLDLTDLPADFLSARPTLMAVLDAMRDRQMIPEPKDYRSWRRQIAALEEAASTGVHEETWSLPRGQTYRVIGRPHPNGALALMIEDISSEMSRTRRYRADLELGQATLDALEEAIAVFSQSGTLVMTNAPYVRLWGHDPAELLSEAGIRSLSRWWRDHSAPSLLWDDAEAFVVTLGDREPWEGEVRLSDGRLLLCRFGPLPGGATVAAFRPLSGDRQLPAPAPVSRLSA